MNANNFESMIKKYADELIKMSKEKILPDTSEEEPTERMSEEEAVVAEESELFPFEEKSEYKNAEEINLSSDISDISNNDFSEETAEEFLPEEVAKESENITGYATFSARVFTGNSAYPIENAKVLVVKDDNLYTFLTTDRDGVTKKVRLPSFPEEISLNPQSDERSVQYTGEVYATGFTPKKGLLISAVGGSDIVLDVQMTPISTEVE